MTTSRRDFVKAAVAASSLGVLGAPAQLFAADPAVGLIFPPLDYPVPPDAKRLYPKGVTFLSGGVGLPGGMTIAGYEEAVPRIIPAAEALAKQGAKAISVFGSSLTFYNGAKFNQELVDRVKKATGLPATTQSNGLVDGLKTANAKRVAIATAYTDVVTGLEAREIRKLFPTICETLSKPVMPTKLIASVRRCLGATAHPNGLTGISVA